MKKAFAREIKWFPFVKDIKKYNFKFFKKDAFSSFSVALLTIPQSIAYSMLAGLPPIAGLLSAIFGSIFVGAFGSSKHLIAGPTTAIAILLQTSIAATINNYYPQVTGVAKEALVYDILANIVFVVGILQIVFGLFNMGKILQFISKPVILGYFVGVFIVIAVNQLYPFLGIESMYHSDILIYKLWNLILQLKETHFLTALLGIVSVGSLIFFKKKFPKFPSSFFIVGIVSILVYFLNRQFNTDISILSKTLLGSTFKIKLYLPSLNLKLLNKVFPAALAISMLGILEIFSVAKTVAMKSSKIIKPNQEIFSIGIGNMFLSFLFGAMPASGSISRSLLNYENKGKTRFSSIFSSILVLILVIFCWPFIKYIPLMALAAILIAMVTTFIDYRQLRFCFTVTKGDALVFMLTMISCFIFSLQVALFIGVIISIASYLKRSAVPHVVEYTFNPSGRLVIVSYKRKARRKIRIIGVSGGLFFGSADLFQNTLQNIGKDPFVKVIILRLNNVYYIDASMCHAILSLYEYLKYKNKHLIISGISNEIWQIFLRASLVKKIGEANLFLTDESKPQLSTWNACMRAKDIVV